MTSEESASRKSAIRQPDGPSVENRKSVIAVVTPFLDKRHGTERCLAEQVERLAEDYEIHLYSTAVQDVDLSKIIWHRVSRVPGPHLARYAWFFTANQLQRWWARRFRKLNFDLVFSPGINCLDADVIGVHIVFAEFYRLAWRELALRRNPLRMWPWLIHRRLTYQLFIALEKRIYTRNEIALTVISHKMERDLARCFKREHDLSLLYHAVDVGHLNPARRQSLREEARRKLQLPEPAFAILIVGNDWKKKGLPCLVEAVASLRNADLWILVRGEDSSYRCRDLFRKAGVENRVRVLPPVPQIESHYAAADLYVGPSLEDSFAFPPLEAMACGVPTIVSSQMGVSEVITDGVDGFILDDPRDSDKLAELIALLYADEGLRQRIGEAAAKTARQYTWDHNAEQLGQLFQEALRRKGNPQRQQMREIGIHETAKSARSVDRAVHPKIGNRKSKITRVLVLTPPLGSAGGIQRYTATLIRALKDELGEQCVRCLARPDFPDQGRRNGRLSARSKLRLGWQAVREAARWRPDLTIATHLNLGPIAWSVASLARRPYWIVVYGIEAWSALPGTKRAALRQADRVIVISTFSREQVARRHQINGERLASLPCTLDESLLMRVAKYGDPGQRDWLSSWSLPWQGSPDFPPSQSAVTGNKRVVLTVGRMAASERYKGHEVVLRALPSVVAKIPDLTYVVVGDGDDRPRLEKLAGESELREHVVFTGEVSDSELAAYYQRSEVFVLPARTVVDDHDPKGEGFGIVFLEAMAFGKPVVGPNYGAPVELVRDGETGLLVDPENPASVGEALLSLLTNPDRGREMGNAGSEWVRRNYSYGSFRERLREILLSPAPCG